jgi:hypothetical protein
MARVLCIGKPYTPPVLNGYTFAPVGIDPEVTLPGPDTFWAAEVDEEGYRHFCVNEEGSPFFLDTDPRAASLQPGFGQGAGNEADPFLPYAQCKNKAELVALAKANLGLDLDETVKRADLDAAVLAALALQPPVTT